MKSKTTDTGHHGLPPGQARVPQLFYFILIYTARLLVHHVPSHCVASTRNPSGTITYLYIIYTIFFHAPPTTLAAIASAAVRPVKFCRVFSRNLHINACLYPPPLPPQPLRRRRRPVNEPKI